LAARAGFDFFASRVGAFAAVDDGLAREAEVLAWDANDGLARDGDRALRAEAGLDGLPWDGDESLVRDRALRAEVGLDDGLARDAEVGLANGFARDDAVGFDNDLAADADFGLRGLRDAEAGAIAGAGTGRALRMRGSGLGGRLSSSGKR
jgi:hypothetical protein